MSPRYLREALAGGDLSGRRFLAPDREVAFADAVAGTVLGGRRGELAGRKVMLVTSNQLDAALALVELDGAAGRIVVCPPDVRTDHFAAIVADAGVDAVVTDRTDDVAALGVPLVVPIGALRADGSPRVEEGCSDWVMLTSGTAGRPKMVQHSLAALTAAIRPDAVGGRPSVWATFYDIRRYGGLQIFLRAVLGRTSLILSQAGEPVVDHLHRLGRGGVSHISGTPSHWRRALMCEAHAAIDPDYVRLSGEIADQAVLDSLAKAYPGAAIGHAYASTEAGVGFAVDDGLEGFPTVLVDHPASNLQMKVDDGSLRIRSSRAASRYMGADAAPLADAQGYIDTGDMVERRGDRYYFVGRRGGIINVGGLKVHPEEVEAVINAHRDVRMSLVKSRRSPIMGAIVVADVVVNDNVGEPGEALKGEILQGCRSALPSHKVPAAIKFVPALEMTTAGKLSRQG